MTLRTRAFALRTATGALAAAPRSPWNGVALVSLDQSSSRTLASRRAGERS
jgi:hypothetical protein